MTDERTITQRRSLQQVKHCVEEALSVLEHGEDQRCALDDLEQAYMLVAKVIPSSRPRNASSTRRPRGRVEKREGQAESGVPLADTIAGNQRTPFHHTRHPSSDHGTDPGGPR